MIMIEVEKRYRDIFNEQPTLFKAPGRINIIGEHTDYNDGFVLPGAIDKYIYVAIGKNKTRTINLHSISYNESISVMLDDVSKSNTMWANYILGVVNELLKRYIKLEGFNVVFDGDIPLGAGLSSSAALECAVAYSLKMVLHLDLNNFDLINIAQQAEHNFTGVKCGIMDQFASVMGKKDHVIKLDCKTLINEYIPLDLGDYRLLLINTNVKHSLASSAYNQRRQECECGVALINKYHENITSLREVNMMMLDKYVKPIDDIVYARCKYVVEEIERVNEACTAIQKRDFKTLGRLLFETHSGLTKLYEVSCAELDFLVDSAFNTMEILGSRLMGGGFGGCTINLIKNDAIEPFVENIGKVYRRRFGLEIESYVVVLENGATSII
jgi:galactokinase